jgi:hypothetical protein
VTGAAGPIRQRGLKIVYDTMLSYPKIPKPPPNPDPEYSNESKYDDVPIRHDAFMRPLPIAPKLPVSGQMLFFGEPV